MKETTWMDRVSEKCRWGLATQMLKAVSKMNNLPCDTHREMFRAVREIGANITLDVDLIREFGRAGESHKNFMTVK